MKYLTLTKEELDNVKVIDDCVVYAKKISPSWMKKNIHVKLKDELDKIKEAYPNCNGVHITAHYGKFKVEALLDSKVVENSVNNEVNDASGDTNDTTDNVVST